MNYKTLDRVLELSCRGVSLCDMIRLRWIVSNACRRQLGVVELRGMKACYHGSI